jgi:hypothetical protein
MKIPKDVVQNWWQAAIGESGYERFSIANYIASKGAAYALERAASVCDALRVKGGETWSEDHLGALTALTEAATAIRALNTEGDK